MNTACSFSIQVLPPQEVRRIAAGEVIDRPAALIREFLDNAIDAGAANIDVAIEEGGSKKVEVADDGSGMSHDDLQMCTFAHATSKIRCLDDLDNTETLGFRGEALAAAAAVARLEIVSAADEADAVAWRLTAGPGGDTPPFLEQANRTRGSTVRALNLYDTIPARKRFLKREGSEAALCRQIFIDKALAFPQINFRLTQDGRPKMFLPAASSKKERFCAALLDGASSSEKQFIHEIHVSGEGFSADVVIGGPELFRADRRMLYVFANGRRIQDYSLINALEYGVQGFFPNGAHPMGAVFVDIDPALADFNIHPAKREARFRDPGAIHHAVTSGLRDFFRRWGLKDGTSAGYDASPAKDPLVLEALSEGNRGYYSNDSGISRGYDSYSPMYHIDELKKTFAYSTVAESSPMYGEPRYVGSIFGVFLLAEWGEKLFVIDQHAAHERILYNRFLAGPVQRQELLIPIVFKTETDEDNRFLEMCREELLSLGIDISGDGNGNGWQINALPEGWRFSDTETVKHILALRDARSHMAEQWAATLCCHQAIRDGDYLDETMALALIKETLALPDPHCPHGRPIWTEITREALYRAVRRKS